MASAAWVAAVFFMLAAVVRLACVLPWMCRPPARRRDTTSGPARTLVVFGSGGHTAEMLSLLRHLPPSRYTPLTYMAADTDVTSEPRAKASGAVPPGAQFVRIPRAREVGQSYVTAVGSTAKAFLACLRAVAAASPDVVLVNGPGTCLPVCLAAVALNFCGVLDARLVFVESVCRVTSMSTTGVLLGWLADSVQVQWPELHAKFPHTTFIGNQM